MHRETQVVMYALDGMIKLISLTAAVAPEHYCCVLHSLGVFPPRNLVNAMSYCWRDTSLCSASLFDPPLLKPYPRDSLHSKLFVSGYVGLWLGRLLHVPTFPYMTRVLVPDDEEEDFKKELDEKTDEGWSSQEEGA